MHSNQGDKTASFQGDQHTRRDAEGSVTCVGIIDNSILGQGADHEFVCLCFRLFCLVI